MAERVLLLLLLLLHKAADLSLRRTVFSVH
jgi:hypothetical protein